MCFKFRGTKEICDDFSTTGYTGDQSQCLYYLKRRIANQNNDSSFLRSAFALNIPSFEHP